MYHVVIAVDEGAERARKQTRAVVDLPAADSEIRATLLHVFTENPGGASATQVGSVRRAEELLEEAGVDVEVAERSGEPAASVLDFADSEDADCICVGGRSRSPAGKAIFGSVAQSIILQSDRPVLVTGSTEE
ncbi:MULTISPECIES: universal stress protein [Halorussus]|uniref:universal stress protein n=1 Tax=Halorussus TaxID=1070314 RepID=UPI000E211E29|nr:MULTISPECIES: universal stress protein [Halorussus]NHN58225.1 universal stress protein [Halorussus sp. JP-T4]